LIGTDAKTSASSLETSRVSRGRAVVFWSLTAAYFVSYFFRSTNAVIAPDLTRELGLSAADLGLMTSFFYAAFALAQIPIGLGLDRYGPRAMQPVLLGIAVAGSLSFAFADSLAALSAARALLGIGLGGSLMAAFKAFSLWYPASRNATVTGFLMAIGALGALAAARPLERLSAIWGWRSIFVVGAALTVVIALCIAVFVRNHPPGAPWPKPSSLTNPLVALRDPRVWRIAVLNFFVAGGLLSIQTLWAGPFLTDAYRLPSAGGLVGVMALGVALGYFGIGWLADRFGIARVAVLAVLGLIVCEVALAARVPIQALSVAYFAFGAFGTGNLLLLSHARAIFPPELTGRVTTTANMFGIGGTFALQWLIGVAVSAFPRVNGRYPPEAYSLAFGALAVCTVIALVRYVGVERQRSGVRSQRSWASRTEDRE
jgi:nitrate/nitrite transporter NarK